MSGVKVHFTHSWFEKKKLYLFSAFKVQLIIGDGQCSLDILTVGADIGNVFP